MSKDPAFLLYPQDFLVGTMTFSNEQVGKYVRMLCFQHQSGHLTEEDMVDIAGDKDAKIWRKFQQDDKGLFYNVRLEEETVKRRKYSESRRKNLQSKKPHMDPHMENVNEDEDIDVNKKGKCLMRNSALSVFDVKEAFLKADDLKSADAKYYFNAAMDWSDAGNNMRTDWIATVRSFARRDLKDGKLKFSIHKPSGGTNMGDLYEPTPLPEKWDAMPESLKKRMGNIGKT